MAGIIYKSTCPNCETEHTIKPVTQPGMIGYENVACECGSFLEFYNMGLSGTNGRWVTPEGFETEAKLTEAR